MSDIPIVYGPPPSGCIVLGSVQLDDGSASNIVEAAEPAAKPPGKRRREAAK